MTRTEAVSSELASMLSSCAVCRLWADQDEGPYHRDAQPPRRDVVEDRDGVALRLGIRLVRDGGTALGDVDVEIWQCDSLGRYSGFPPPDSSVVATAPRGEYLADQTFLRGRQTTDAAGMVEFRTIYPGWYPGRTVHIHLMVNTNDAVLTSQLYFPDEVSDQVLALSPYAERPGRDTPLMPATRSSRLAVIRPCSTSAQPTTDTAPPSASSCRPSTPPRERASHRSRRQRRRRLSGSATGRPRDHPKPSWPGRIMAGAPGAVRPRWTQRFDEAATALMLESAGDILKLAERDEYACAVPSRTSSRCSASPHGRLREREARRARPWLRPRIAVDDPLHPRRRLSPANR
jgi:protocatechuate 3,4-dioxygenase beta subunit